MSKDHGPTVSLLYHDVVLGEGEGFDPSGFYVAGSELYRLDAARFRDHLKAVRDSGQTVTTVTQLLSLPKDALSVTFTFDDGGVSAHTVIAAMLEEYGWRGHFFISTDFIGAPGFLSAEQISDLHARGHLIGSHSCSHPERMSKLDRASLQREWSHSCEVLAEMLGERVVTASVPNGYSSPEVVAAAERAGIEWLFTSDPTSSSRMIGGCRELGRYSVQVNTSTRAVADLISDRSLGRPYQAALWGAKKVVKSVAGESYLALRAALLRGK